MLLLVFTTHISSLTKLFPFAQTSSRGSMKIPCQQGTGSMYDAQACRLPGMGTPPAPYTCSSSQTVAQRGASNICKQPSLPTQALSAFLSVYSSNSTASPTKSAQRLQRTERVCCPQGTDNAFPFDPPCRKAALGAPGSGGEHSPVRPPLLFLPKFPADPAIWLDWQNKSGKTTHLRARCCCATAHYICTRSKRTFLKLLK